MVKGKLVQNHKGWGVEATAFISKGETVEVCPVIPMIKDKDHSHINQKQLARYVFSWNKDCDVLVQGWGGIYNHDEQNNMVYSPDDKNMTMVYKATRDIQPGEELLINYGYCPTKFEWMNLIPQFFKTKIKIGWF